MDIQAWLLFLVIFLSAAILPGPNVAFCVAQSLDRGFRQALPGALGFGFASGFQAFVVLSGLSIVIRRHPYIALCLKWIGVIYLLYLALKSLRSKAQVTLSTADARSPFQMFTGAVLVSLTNAKGLLTNIALFPMFINSASPYVPQCIVLISTAALLSASVYAGYIVLARHAVNVFRSRRQISIAIGFIYIGVAALIAVAM